MWYYAGCCFIEYGNAECHFADWYYSDCHFTECCNAECHFAEWHYSDYWFMNVTTLIVIFLNVEMLSVVCSVALC